ncbi:MAG: polyprenyl synthetase family protein [Terriglobales bacterium]
MSSAGAANPKEVFELLRDDLAAIEREFGRDTVSSVGVVTEIGEYLRGGGGKRIRPALLLLACKLFPGKTPVLRSHPSKPESGLLGAPDAQGGAPLNAGPDGLWQSSIRLGAVVEIIHTATLVHDDIIDEAQTRRGRPAANTQWGNSKCVLAGDWLYMQAFKVAVQERKFRVLDVLIDLTQQMVEGELLQMEKLGRLVTLEEYLDLIFRKTACLFSVCMRLGGILADASPEEEENLAAYGRNLGMAFQIVDDVLDLTASEEVLGKPVASDLREGKVTMAVIAALAKCTPAERAVIETVLRERAFESVSHEQVLALLNRYNGVETAMARAADYAAAASKAISDFPDSNIKRALLWMPEFVVARSS